MKKKVILILCILGILLGVGAASYPLLAARYAEKKASRIIADCEREAEAQSPESKEALLREARAYNRRLRAGEVSVYDTGSSGYWEILDISGSGFMGSIEIPKIGVRLPIYHGVSGENLHHGVGHMPQSSFPIGGPGTHAFLAAHTGQATCPLFSDLPLLNEGDRFSVHILGEALTYEVEEIRVTDPEDISAVQIQEGRDLVTLLTCYPYPANTQRLLVTGSRVPEAAPVAFVEEAPEAPVSGSGQRWLLGAALGSAGFAFPGLILGILSLTRRKKHAE